MEIIKKLFGVNGEIVNIIGNEEYKLMKISASLYYSFLKILYEKGVCLFDVNSIVLPTAFDIENAAGVEIMIDKDKIIISDILPDLSKSEQLLFSNNQLPEILGTDYSETLNRLLSNSVYDNLLDSMNTLLTVNGIIERSGSKVNIMRELYELLYKNKVVTPIWFPQLAPSTDQIKYKSFHPEIFDTYIQNFIKLLLKDMTGDEFILNEVPKDPLSRMDRLEITTSHLKKLNTHDMSADLFGSGVLSVLRYMPGIISTILEGGICFIGGENDEVTGPWHSLIKHRLPEYLEVLYNKSEGKFIQVIQHNYNIDDE